MQSTKTKPAHRGTGIVIRLLAEAPATTKYIAVITIVGVLAPFMHIFWLHSNQEGFFGFPLMSSFFFAIGFPVTSICFGLLLKFFADDLKTLKKPVAFISNIFIFIGVYFIIWAIWAVKDFPVELYYTIMFTMSVFITIFIDYINRFAPNSQKLKNVIRYLMDLIVQKARSNGHIKDDRQYVKDIVEPAINFLNDTAREENSKAG